MTNLILLFMLVFGAGHTVYAGYYGDGITPSEIVRNSVLGIVGLLGLVVANYRNILMFLAKIYIPSDGCIDSHINNQNNRNSNPVHMDDYSLLMLLRQRFSSDESGFEMLAKLADSVFRGKVKNE